MIDILPCPFCGGTGKIQAGYVSLGGSKRYALIRCMNCDATGPKAFGDIYEDDLKAVAIRDWNDTADTRCRESIYS